MLKLLKWLLEPVARRIFSLQVNLGLVRHCVDAPDMTQVNEAAKSSSDIAKEALAWFKGEAARTQGQRDTAAATQQQVADAQLTAMKGQNDLAKQYTDYETGTVLPLKQRIVADAQTYDTPDRQQAAADTATADVRSATTRAMEAGSRNLARMGYDPAVNLDKMAASSALAEAGAATRARQTVENTGRAMRMDAAGMQSSATTAATTGANAGGVAVGAAGAANGTASSGAGLMGQGFGIGLQGHSQAGNLYGQSAQLGMQADMANLSTFGSLAGAGIAKFSDERMKDGTGKPLSGRKARMAIEALPVDEAWTYKAGSPGDDGGQPHDGPMAADVRRTMGDRAAPRTRMGDTVDLLSIQGNLLAAVADISRDVRRLKTRMGAAS